MRTGDLFRLSFDNLRRQKLRTFLTTLGVAIGVTALVLMVSLGVGLKIQLLKLFETDFMLRSMTVTKGNEGKESRSSFLPFRFEGTPLAPEDIALIASLSGVESVTPNLNLVLNMVTDENNPNATIIAPILAIPQSTTIDDLKTMIVAGEFWKSPDERAVIIPSSIADGEKIVGKKVRFKKFIDRSEERDEKTMYTVAGVYDSNRMGLSGGAIWMAITHAEELRASTKGGNIPLLWDPEQKRYLSAFVKAKSIGDVERVKEALRAGGYQPRSSLDAVHSINILFLIVEGFLACIGGVGLIVSLLGIANTMAMAVLERRREIGILKALGAKDGTVRSIFLLESAFIGLAGGVAGNAAAWAAGKALNMVSHAQFNLPQEIELFHLALWLAVASILFSTTISALAGYFPARRAARLDPVKALHYE